MLLNQALDYLDMGWSVIPLRGKRPLLGSWLEYQKRLATRDEVREWFKLEPGANIGIVTGQVSGLVVIDFDGIPETYDRNVWEWFKEHGIDVPAWAAITGKGAHLYYAHPGGFIKNGVRLGKIGEADVDVRADGGYVVAPQSIHPETGKAYRWLSTGCGKPTELIPDAFRQMVVERDEFVSPSSTGSSIVTVDNDIHDTLVGVAAGGRNHAAAKITGWFLKVTKGDENAAWTMLTAWNGRNDPPLPESELARTFESILRAYRNTHAEEETTEAVEQTTLLTGKDWADAVRDVPPRVGIACPSLPSLDQVGGVVPKDLVILAARPGMGKSTVAWGTVADVAIEAGAPTVIFSTEMTAADVARWIASKMHRTPVKDLTSEEWASALALIAKSPMTVCDKGAMTVEAIVKIVESMPGTRYVVVDHIQRIRAARRTDSRNQELEYIASTLKSLAKDRNLTVLLLSQMNRAGDMGGRPNLTHLKDSGALEQEADAVIFLWSPAEDSTANPLDVEFYLAKNRHGALDAVRCRFHKHLKYFEVEDVTRHLEVLRAQSSQKEKLNSLLASLDY